MWASGHPGVGIWASRCGHLGISTWASGYLDMEIWSSRFGHNFGHLGPLCLVNYYLHLIVFRFDKKIYKFGEYPAGFDLLSLLSIFKDYQINNRGEKPFTFMEWITKDLSKGSNNAQNAQFAHIIPDVIEDFKNIKIILDMGKSFEKDIKVKINEVDSKLNELLSASQISENKVVQENLPKLKGKVFKMKGFQDRIEIVSKDIKIFRQYLGLNNRDGDDIENVEDIFKILNDFAEGLKGYMA